MFLIIGVWGGARRVYASFKFFLYTLLGSLLMLLAILAMYGQAGTTEIPALLEVPLCREPANLALVRVPGLLRREASDVAGPYLASRRARRGANGRLRHPCGDPSEDGRLRLPAVSAADVPCGVRHLCAAHVRARRDRDHLHLARRLRPEGHEEAHRLFVRRAYGLRHHRRVLGHGVGRARRGLPDGQPRHRLRRALPLRRHRLRPDAYARDRSLWRACRPDARLRLHVHGLHHGQCRPARHERLHRRVPVAARNLPARIPLRPSLRPSA